MADPCPTCARPLPDDSPHGLCPACCLLNLGLGAGGASDEESIAGVELGPLLGKGSFGEVYEAIQLHAGYRRVAVKILRTDHHGSAQRARFLEEIQILGLLEHPHIARILSSGRTGSGKPYYLMEFVEGEPLDRHAAPLPLVERLELLRQVVEAVAHAHQKGIAHRDLKPGNIIVEQSSGLAKVIDFGIARAFEGPASLAREHTLVGQRIGTPRYMSPEQLAGDPKVDLRTDIWSLGLLLYELVLGRPVLGEIIEPELSWEENAGRLRSFPFPRLPDRELDWIARKACALDPAERYPTGQALLDDLAAKRDNRPVSVGRSYRGYRLRKSIARHRLGYALALAGLLLLITLTISGWIVSSREHRSRLALAREHARTLEAREASQRAASDSALLAGARAMDLGNFALARDSLTKATELWPDNAAARYARHFLDTRYPEARFLDERALPFTVRAAAADPEGRFVLEDESGKRWILPPQGAPAPVGGGLPQNPPPWRHEDFEIAPTRPGLLEFRDPVSGEPLLTPLVFGDGGEPVAFSAEQEIVLSIRDGRHARRHSIADLLGGYALHRLPVPIVGLDFTRKNGDLWMVDEEGEIYLWSDEKPPKQVLEYLFAKPRLHSWNSGEHRSRGLPESSSGLIGLTQLNVRAMLDRASVIHQATPQGTDAILAALSDGSLYYQLPGKLYHDFKGLFAEPVAMAVDYHGDYGAHIDREGTLRLLKMDDRTVPASWPLKVPAQDAVILDTGELVIAHRDGTLTVRDLHNAAEPQRTIPLFAGPVDGFHVRSVPGRAEFVACLDGKVNLHHISAKTGEHLGVPMRHRHQVHWICFSNNGDILITIDQRDDLPGTLRIWSLRLGQEIVPSIAHPAPILWATLLDQGRRIATSCADGTVRRWVLEEEK